MPAIVIALTKAFPYDRKTAVVVGGIVPTALNFII